MSMEVENFYEVLPDEYLKNQNYKNEIPFLPHHPFRCLIIGSSGSRKTLLALNLIKKCACFEVLYICAKNIEEPLYRFVRDKMGNRCIAVDSVNELIDLKEVDDSKQNCILFDDMVSEGAKEQKKISEYFIRGRKNNCSCIYISQSYYKIPKLIRANANVLAFKKLNDKRDLNMILTDNLHGSITKDILKHMYDNSLKTKDDFFMICNEETNPNRVYRKNFSQTYIIDESQPE